jgi:hypothetical protein
MDQISSALVFRAENRLPGSPAPRLPGSPAARSLISAGPHRRFQRRYTILGYRRRSSVRLPVRSRRAIQHAGRAFSLVAVGPLLGGLPGQVVPLGRARRGPAVIDD